jgi:hypothetical protein
MLEYLETKECHDFLGCCLERNETIVAENFADDAVLEGVSSNCDGGWLQKCHFSTRKSVDDAGNDRALCLMMD